MSYHGLPGGPNTSPIRKTLRMMNAQPYGAERVSEKTTKCEKDFVGAEWGERIARKTFEGKVSILLTGVSPFEKLAVGVT
jgi:hypothetical protein